MEEGAFSDLPFQGQPLPIEDDAAAGEWAMAHRILRNAGAAPPWIEADKEVRRLLARRDELVSRPRRTTPSGQARERTELTTLVASINEAIARVNAEAPTIRQHRRALDLETELARLDAGTAGLGTRPREGSHRSRTGARRTGQESRSAERDGLPRVTGMDITTTLPGDDMTTSTTLGIKTVLHPVSDLAAAKAVYTALLGIEPQADAPYYVGYDAEGQHIGLVPGGGPQGMTTPVAYWHVADIEAKLAEVTAAGGTLHEAAHDVGGGRLVATFSDPDGNVLGLVQDR